jgi:hypothetical protein
LVPQEPDDEPAEKLLERIQAEKAKLVRSRRSVVGRKKLLAADCKLQTES